MKILIAIFVLLLVQANCDNWAVIIAGSSGFDNYRHQADTCHAYQTLIKKGIPADHIINFAYDDIANNQQNPFPGTLFNAPSNTSAGWNVYAGCKFDYTGALVTTENFLSVLTGDAAALLKKGTGKYLKSTESDSVFIYFADHGGPGILGFPSQYLYKKQLTTALETMHKKKMYKELVFYMEACESGSMFTGFSADLNIYALTAANASQSSWGTYCPPDGDWINGTEINSCLGDTFSVNWLENTDKATTSKETLEQQYEAVKKLTTQSDVCQWGDKKFVSEVIGTFLGMKAANQFLLLTPEKQHQTFYSQESQYLTRVNYLKRQMELDPTNYEKKIAYQREILLNSYFDGMFETIAMMSGVPEAVHSREYPELTQDDCFIELFEEFQDRCMNFTEYAVQYSRVFIHMCEKKPQLKLKQIIDDACGAF